MNKLDRRSFLKRIGGLASGALLAIGSQAHSQEPSNCELWSPPTPPQSFRVLNVNEVREVLKKFFPKACKEQGGVRLIRNRSFKTTSIEEWQRMLAEDKTDLLEDMMPSDYAFRLMGQFSTPGLYDYALGLIYSEQSPYYLNFIITQEANGLAVWKVEPTSTGFPEKMSTGDPTVRLVLI